MGLSALEPKSGITTPQPVPSVYFGRTRGISNRKLTSRHSDQCLRFFKSVMATGWVLMSQSNNRVRRWTAILWVLKPLLPPHATPCGLEYRVTLPNYRTEIITGGFPRKQMLLFFHSQKRDLGSNQQAEYCTATLWSMKFGWSPDLRGSVTRNRWLHSGRCLCIFAAIHRALERGVSMAETTGVFVDIKKSTLGLTFDDVVVRLS